MAMAATASSIVAGNRAAISATTGVLERYERPKSPRTAPEKRDVLHQQRPVEPQLPSQLGNRLRVGPRPENGLRRITAGRMEHEKDEQRHPQQDGDRQRQPPQE